MNDIFPILITRDGATKRYSAEFQTGEQYSTAWHNVLKAAYRDGCAVVCGCGGNGPARIAIKHFSSSNTFHLAKFGRSGGQHVHECQFWSSEASESADGYASGVIKQLDNGSVQIRLAFGLMVNEPTPGQREPDLDRAPGPKTGQASMRLLGLLHYLWVEAGLNCWRKGWETRRNKRTVFWRLNSAASSVMVGKRELSGALLLPADTPSEKDSMRNRERVNHAVASGGRLVVVAPLARHTELQEAAIAKQLKIAGFHGIPPIFLQGDTWARCCDRHLNAIAAWRAGTPVVVIAQIETKQGKKGVTATAVDLALMAVTEKWIPVDSSYERAVAERLVREGRGFRKPLRFDRAEDVVMPDFVLEDKAGEVPCEVFGRSDPEYRSRMEEKKRLYDERYGTEGWWSWDAATNPDPMSMPAFPPPL